MIAYKFILEMHLNKVKKWLEVENIINNPNLFVENLIFGIDDYIAHLDSDRIRLIIYENNNIAYTYFPFLMLEFMKNIVRYYNEIIKGGIFYQTNEGYSTLFHSKEGLFTIYETEFIEGTYLRDDNWSLNEFKVELDENIFEKIEIIKYYRLPVCNWIIGTFSISGIYARLLLALKKIFDSNAIKVEYKRQIENIYEFLKVFKQYEKEMRNWIKKYDPMNS